MAGPQMQHSQRPNSAYYTGLNGSGGGGGGGGTSAGMASSASHTGLHALRQVGNETELIYRGSHSNGTVNELPSSAAHHQLLTGRVQHHQAQQQERQQQVSSIAGTGSSVTDALIGTITSGGGGSGETAASSGCTSVLGLKKSSTQRSIEIIVDASQCGREVVVGAGSGPGSATANMDPEDVEQGGGGGQESLSSHRKSSRHRHRPLHRRLITYVRNLFQGSTTQNDSELEEFETPARYRPDSLSALSRATRFTEDEIKRIYRGFKAECPTGVVKEDTFKVIYSQFFPQGANPTLYAHYVFNTLDQDHSGIVSFEDFVQGLSILSRGSVEEKLRWTFSLYDINGDGFITREEMTDIVTAIYELMGRLPDECPEEEKIKGKVEHIFQKMDINRDGVVTLEEFLEACHNDDAISRSMSGDEYTVRRRRRSRSQQQHQYQQQQPHLQPQQDTEKSKCKHKTKNKQQQKQQQPHSTRQQKCCYIIDMDGGETSTTTTTTSAATCTTLNWNVLSGKFTHGNAHHLLPEEADEYDEDEDDDDKNQKEEEDDDSYRLFVCRHCQRPQSAGRRSHSKSKTHAQSQLQMKSRKRSKSKKRHQTKAGAGQTVQARWPELNVANEQAIRFRCPQVGPLVGRDVHTPQPLHFHHPQSQCRLRSRSRLQRRIPKNAPASPSPRPLNSHQNPKPNRDQNTHPLQPSTIAAPAPSELAPLPPLVIVASGAGCGGIAELVVDVHPLHPQPSTTPDSPSLVTVSTWYTVAKQGVSC
ncbi:hypothetical protein KR032_012150 [Drosophila birchii]|nr:hypothetical protein KR032_012150 [Drosophila birchii]